jgi:hypothetical protein
MGAESFLAVVSGVVLWQGATWCLPPGFGTAATDGSYNHLSGAIG